MHSSPVFRSMLADWSATNGSDSPRRLCFVDEELETGAIWSAAFDILYRAEIHPPPTWRPVPTLEDVNDLAKKWECLHLMQTIRCWSRLWAHDTRSESELLFALGARIDDEQTAYIAVSVCSGIETWSPDEDESLGYLPSALSMNPLSWPADLAKNIPVAYLWAYGRAWEEQRMIGSTKDAMKKVADRFLVLLKALKGELAQPGLSYV
jgi:hypothetical protein